MPWVLVSAALWFAGFALLIPVAPLWVIHVLALAVGVTGGCWARPSLARRGD